jgi:hypothetical protein
MSDGYKQGIDNEAKEKLKRALTEFCDKHPSGNAGIKGEVEAAAGKFKLALEKVDAGIAVAGVRPALRDFIESNLGKMTFTKPYLVE